MRPQQLLGIGERKARESVVPALPFDFDRWYGRKVPEQLRLRLAPLRTNTERLSEAHTPATRRACRERAQSAAAGEVTFMNRTLDVASGTGVEWYADGLDRLPRLWRLKLYAFDPLSWHLIGVDALNDTSLSLQATFEEWIRDWVEAVEIGGPNYLRRAWTPYAVSLRVLTWSRFLACRSRESETVDSFDSLLAHELYKNAAFLVNHVERDVGGNHLVENGVALIAAGVVFGEKGTQWVDAGVSILEDAAATQFLSDGCHFERSPMYHVQVVTRYLTARDVLDKAGRPVPDAISDAATDGVRFLERLRPPDGEFPLLNDAVHGQTLSLGECLDYARATGVDVTPEEARQAMPANDPGDTMQDKADRGDGTAGLGWLDTDRGQMLVDGGPVGPPHLPGHAHSDLLGVLLWLDGTPVVTDTGTFDYEGGDRRQYARGVCAHNTVQVGDQEPIELGGRFLMGPRPTPTVRWERGAIDGFEGYYRSRSFGCQDYGHHRAVAAGDRWWLVWDRVTATDGPIRSRLHMHPAVTTTRTTPETVRLGYGTDREAWIHAVGDGHLCVGDGQYFPAFGVEKDRDVVSITADTQSSASTTVGWGYLVTPADVDPPVVERGDRAEAVNLQVDGDTHALPQWELIS